MFGRKTSPYRGRPFRDGPIDIKRRKMKRRTGASQGAGRRTLGPAAAALSGLAACALLIFFGGRLLSRCALLADTLRCAGVFVAFLIPCIAVLAPIRLLTGIPSFIFRKLMHTAAFTAITFTILRAASWQAASLTFVLGAASELALLSVLENRPWFAGLLVQKSRGEVKRSLAMFFLMAAALTAVCWGALGVPGIVAAAILMWGTGDAAAALVGIPFGRHRIRLGGGTKSLEGSAAMLAASFIAGTCVLLCVQGMSLPAALLSAFAGALPGMLAELLSPGEYDTATVPIVIAAVLLACCRLAP